MLNRDETLTLLERVLSQCPGEAEVALLGGELALTRFANSVIHQNVHEERLALSVRLQEGRRTARATTTRLDHEGEMMVIDEARQAVAQAPESPDLPQMLDGAAGAIDSESTPLPEPEERAETFARCRALADSAGASLFGYAAAWRGWIGEYDEARAFAVANSRGVRRFAAPAHQALSLTVKRGEATAWTHLEAPVGAPLDAEPACARALQKVEILARGLQRLEPAEMTVVLEPAAAADLLAFLGHHVTGRSVLDDESCLAGKQGERLFGENVMISDDAAHPLQRGVPFDAEGTARQTVPLITGGSVAGFVHDRITAAKMDAAPTGHALPIPSGAGSQAAHLVMAGGEASLAALIASTERGVLVTRSWYTNFVDFKRATITGMTRDGTFLIEDGKVTTGLHDLRFNISLFELLNQIEALGPQARFNGVVAPAMRVRGFRFTS